jgi:hypothetical protein
MEEKLFLRIVAKDIGIPNGFSREDIFIRLQNSRFLARWGRASE